MNEQQQIPGEEEMRKIRELRDRFGGFSIVREARDQGAGVRYCAYGVTITIHPHTIITSRLEELEEELEKSAGDLGFRAGADPKRPFSGH